MSTDTAPPIGLWDKQQAAAYLGISVNTLNHWICDRKIVFVKMGALVKFRKADLDRFIMRNVHLSGPKRRPDGSNGPRENGG